MRKCPECSEENINESLFCKHCGRCLLSPDPETPQRLSAVLTQYFEAPESLDFYDGSIAEKSRAPRLKRYPTKLSVILGWLMLLNLIVYLLMTGIVIK